MKKSSFGFIVFCAASILIGGCGLFRKCPENIPISKIDTIWVQTIAHDTLLQVTADSSWLQQLLACQDGHVILLKQLEDVKGQKGHVVNTITNNVLTSKCYCDTTSIRFGWVEQDSVKIEVKTVQLPPVTTNIINKWQTIQMWGGRFLLLEIILGLIYLGFKLYKAFQPKL